jgi:hypothetical protein
MADSVMCKLELFLRVFDEKHLEGLSLEELEQCEGVVGAALTLSDGLSGARMRISALADRMAGLSRDTRVTRVPRVKRRAP